MSFNQSVSLIRVYDRVLGDGKAGGIPHVHLLASEAYVVVSGSGRLETLSCVDGLQSFALSPGHVVFIHPGIVHRTANDFKLQIAVLMESGGLAEVGDLEPTILEDVTDSMAKPVGLRFRNVAVDGFNELARAFEVSSDLGRITLQRFLGSSAIRIRSRLPEILRLRQLQLSEATKERMSDLRANRLDYLAKHRVQVLCPEEANFRDPGFCGMRLRCAETA